MITRMKKLTFLVFYKEYQEFLERMGELGVLHVVQKQQGALDNTEVQEQMRLLSRYAAAIEALEKVEAASPNPSRGGGQGSAMVISSPSGGVEGASSLLAKYDALLADKAATEARIQLLAKDEQMLAPWGNFEPASVERLIKAGYDINFFACAERLYKEEWESEYNAITIRADKSKVYFITVTAPGTEISIEAELCRLPQTSLEALTREIEALKAKVVELDEQIVAFANAHLAELKAAHEALQSDINFSKVALSADSVADNKLMLLQGWAPEKSLDTVREYLDKTGHYYQVDDPTAEDDIPIQLSNNKFFRLFEPLTKLYKIGRASCRERV